MPPQLPEIVGAFSKTGVKSGSVSFLHDLYSGTTTDNIKIPEPELTIIPIFLTLIFKKTSSSTPRFTAELSSLLNLVVEIKHGSGWGASKLLAGL